MKRRSSQLFTRPDRGDVCRLSLELLEGRLAPGSTVLGTMAETALVGPAAAARSPAGAVPDGGFPATSAGAAVFLPVPAVSAASAGTTLAVAAPGPDSSREVAGLAGAGPAAAPSWDACASLGFDGRTPPRPTALLPGGTGSAPVLAGPTGSPGPSAGVSPSPAPVPVNSPATPAAGSLFVSGGAQLAAPASAGFPPQTTDNLSGSVTLTPDKPPPQLVGDRITWTATATNSGDNPVFQFSVGPAGGSLQVVQDFSHDNTFIWVPMQEGTYNVQVIVEDNFGGTETATTVVSDAVNSRATGANPVITPTTNPLVVLYSAPPTTAPSMHVDFRPADDPSAPWVSTDTKPCLPGLSTNFLVAGMRPNTTYAMTNVTNRGSSSIQFFTPSSLPTTLNFPQFTVRQPPSAESDVSLGMVFHLVDALPNPAVNVLATDLAGNVEWYYDSVATNVNGVFGTSLVPGGTVLLLGQSPSSASNGLNNDLLLEADLAGHTLRETNSDAVNAQLTALGKQTIDGFHHDAQRLPDGKTAVLAGVHRTIDLNGTPTRYDADMVLVLDQNFQVVWTWNAFDFLDVHRLPTLAGDMAPGYVDWLHSNAVSWSPADGNLLVSMRSQDWVIKIDYENGAGDGHVVWRLGQDGDFTINSSDPSPWFSHQHNAHFIDNTTLLVFDNGNTRQASDPSAHSRGQALILDEQTRRATLALNVDLGNYSSALGAAQRLPNGNFIFTSGFQNFPVNPFGQSIEVGPDGTPVYVLEAPDHEYRSYRMRGLYGSTDNEADTTTSLTSSANSSGLGQPVTFTATVTPNTTGGATPTGTATFRDGTAVLGSASLDASGVARFTTTALPAGGHSVTVTYDGDTNFTASTSAPVSQTVNPSATATILASSANPSVRGQAVTLTATVTPSAAGPFTAGGTVTFYDGGTPLGDPVPVVGGTAALTTSALVIGPHAITAAYTGDANFVGSTAAALNQVVILPTTAVSLANTPSVSALGQAVAFTATVTPSGGSGTPTGTVTFQEGTAVLATVPLNGSGVATFSTAALTPGTHSISATYNGDANFTASTSPSVTQTVNKAVTAVTLAGAPNPSVAGQAITFTATVNPFTAGPFTAGGTVTFYDGGTPLGSPVPLTAGTAAFTTASLAVGSHSVTAVYTGDANFTGSTAPAVAEVVNKVTTTTALASSLNPSLAGQPVTFTATISPAAAGSFTAGGTVTFYDGGTPLGNPVPLTAGSAALTTSSLAVGTRSVTAVYSGDGNFTGSSSAVLAQVVNAGTMAVVVSLTNSPSNSVSGQAVTFTATVTPTSGGGTPTGTVTFLADGATPLGAAPLARGTATLTSSVLPTGTHTVVAAYSGDANFATGTSPPRTQVVALAATTTAVTGSGSVARPGQSVTFTATVAAGTGTSLSPGGTVTFFDGTTALGSPIPLANGRATWTGSTLGAGVHTVTAKYNGDANFAASTSAALSQVILAGQFFALGGAHNQVQVRRTSDGSLVVQFAPFAAPYNDGVTVAMADVNGDGFEDLIVGSAAGSGHVKVYDGKALANGTLTAATAEAHKITEFMGFDPAYHIGVNVAAGYIDGSTHADLILGAASGNPQVKVLNSAGIGTGGFDAAHPDASLLATWFAYGLNFNIGATVAAGDIEGTGIADVVTGATAGNPNVKVFSGKAIHDRAFNGGNADAHMLANFFAYAIGQGLGVNVAVGDVNGDHLADLITAPTVSSPDVRVYDGRAVANGSLTTPTLAAHLLDQFYAFDPKYGSGVTLAAADFTGTGRASILTAASISPHYRLVDGLNSKGTLPPALKGIDAVLANFTGGLNVGA